MKWILTGVAALNLAGSAHVLAFRPDLYEWTYMLTDVVLVYAASLTWLAEKETV